MLAAMQRDDPVDPHWKICDVFIGGLRGGGEARVFQVSGQNSVLAWGRGEGFLFWMQQLQLQLVQYFLFSCVGADMVLLYLLICNRRFLPIATVGAMPSVGA